MSGISAENTIALAWIIEDMLHEASANRPKIIPTRDEILVMPYRVTELTARCLESIAQKWGSALALAEPSGLLEVDYGQGHGDPLVGDYKDAIYRLANELWKPQQRPAKIDWIRLRLATEGEQFDWVFATYTMKVPFYEGRAVIAFTYGVQKTVDYRGITVFANPLERLSTNRLFLLPDEWVGEIDEEDNFVARSAVAHQYCQWLQDAIADGFRNWQRMNWTEGTNGARGRSL